MQTLSLDVDQFWGIRVKMKQETLVSVKCRLVLLQAIAPVSLFLNQLVGYSIATDPHAHEYSDGSQARPWLTLFLTKSLGSKMILISFSLCYLIDIHVTVKLPGKSDFGI